MPEESKKGHHKSKHDPKDQRRPRHQRQQPAAESKVDKKPEETKVPTPTKPVYEDPGPEFYQNLKRETDEILKITEETQSKYKKKEIQSNWSKYEVPVESYDEIAEQENMGADYEKLIQAPLSVGGHFQFKHEKTWDVNSGPSLYDKYFDINTDTLSIALSTIPFYERNSIDKASFTQTDILNMDNRATRYKQKYYNDKSYTNAELNAQDRILDFLKNSLSISNEDVIKKDMEENHPQVESIPGNSIPPTESPLEIKSSETKFHNKDIEFKLEATKVIEPIKNKTNTNLIGNPKGVEIKTDISEEIDDIDDLIREDTAKFTAVGKISKEVDEAIPGNNTAEKETGIPVAEAKDLVTKNAVIESPEDLEKWLDDFLDG